MKETTIAVGECEDYPTTINKSTDGVITALFPEVSDNELLQVKEVLAKYFAHRLSKHVDQLWQEKELTAEDMEQWLIDEDQ